MAGHFIDLAVFLERPPADTADTAAEEARTTYLIDMVATACPVTLELTSEIVSSTCWLPEGVPAGTTKLA